MDPVTHLIVNTGLYTAISDKGLALDSPEFLAASAGALIPDGDAFLQIFGDIPYLKNHRGMSHSLLGGLILSGVIGLFFSVLFSHNLITLWAYGFLGVASHLLLDWCNSYGIKLLWPLSKKMYTGNVLVVIEPVLILLSFIMIFSFAYDYAIDFSGYTENYHYPMYLFHSNLGWVGLAGQIGYILARHISRINLTKYLHSRFLPAQLERLMVWPASNSFSHWDFIAETEQAVYVGRAPIFKHTYWIKEKLSKKIEQEVGRLFAHQALNSKTGQFFKEFTPYYLIKHEQTSDDKHQIVFIDLRYHMGSRFLHKATVRFQQQGIVEEATFQPYHPKRKVPVK